MPRTKTTNWVLGILAVSLLALAGCKKSGQSLSPPREFFGVKVDLPRLEVDFANASPAMQDSVDAIKASFRYGRFTQAGVELDKLSNNPDLTPSQKKLVGDLLEQTNQVIAKAPATFGQ